MAHIRKISQDILVYRSRSHIKVSALPWRLQTHRKACDRVGVTRYPCNSLVSSLLAGTPTGRTEKRWRLPKNGRNPALQQDRQVILLANFTLIIWYCTYIWSGTAEGGWESWGYWSLVTVNAVETWIAKCQLSRFTSVEEHLNLTNTQNTQHSKANFSLLKLMTPLLTKGGKHRPSRPWRWPLGP